MPFLKPGLRPPLLAAAIVLGLSACAVDPPPKSAIERAEKTPAAWVAPLPHGGQAASLQDWWSQFDDPILGQLIAQTQAASPSLQQALARIRQARAQAAQAGAAQWPGVNLSASTQGQRLPLISGVPTQTMSSVGLDAAWEIDLFARVRQQGEAAEARAQASELDWHAARVSLAAEVAQSYVGLRACERLLQISEADSQAMVRLSQWSADKLKVGLESAGNAALLQAAAAEAQNRLLSQRADCELVIKGLVSLSGQTEAALRAQLAPSFARLPGTQGLKVEFVPADILTQRPDLASLQRQVMAAWSERGAAEAGRYPQLQLGGSISLSALQVSGGGRTDGNGWSFGPSLSLPIFDAGARRAQADGAQARFDEALAGYRAAVLQAVREVEEALVRLDSAQQRERYAQSGADGYQRSALATAGSWRAGFASAAELEQAHRLTLNAQSALVQVQAARLAAWFSLYKASGGGWKKPAKFASPESESTL
ncbi:efflux transporter outer membrane subunit [Roseateles oligotrophus]|uniref:Efflux transporter outer membrane subunit n=1 Tax=Roseateles oligotrophus TaxID=1769250 RepID=A0ABT2YGJ8_9BURK|nr:efflux transporter outer membrane subunit [Roseateles oligotrophus]MCV2369149.1 efflux transporter outer membrane subunit [Roseateles oligotrophus]